MWGKQIQQRYLWMFVYFLLICAACAPIGETAVRPTQIPATIPSTEPPTLLTLEELVTRLQAANLLVERDETFPSHIFSAPIQSLRVAGSFILVYEYASVETAVAEAAWIGRDGTEITYPDPENPRQKITMIIEPTGTPHYFRLENLLVNYNGDDIETLAGLTQVLGPQFAGGPIPQTLTTAVPANATAVPTDLALAAGTPRATAVPPTPWVVSVPADRPPESLPLKEEITFTVVQQMGGRVNAVALDGDIAYVGIGPRLVLVDISDPVTPRFLGQSDPLPELINAVVAQNGLAFVAGSDVYVLDVHDFAEPVMLSKLSDVGEMNFCYISDLILMDEVLYAFDACPNLRAIDISDPRQLAVRSNIHPTSATGITLFNNTLALAEESGRVRFIDKVDPNKTLGQFPLILPPLPREFAATNEILVGITGGDWLDCHTNSWQIINIANETAPQLITEFDPQNCVNDIAAAGDTLIAAAGDGLRIYDVSDAARPILVGKFVPPAGFSDLQKIALSQNIAYFFSAAGGAAQVHTLDLAQPDAPIVVGNALDLSPELSDDALDFGSQFAASWATGFYIQESTLFLRISTYEQPPHYVIAIDITQPATPLLLGTYDWAAPKVAGNIVYTPVDGGVTLYDMANSADPILIDTLQVENVSAFWNTLFAWGNYLLLTEGGTVYDISEPLHPQAIGQFQYLPQTLVNVDNTLYALGNDLFVVDISNLPRPPVISRFTPQSMAFSNVTEMVLADNVVYFQNGDPEAGIWALNVETRSGPYLAGHFLHPYFGYPPLSPNSNFAVKDDLLYLAAGDFGLLIVQVER